jgi:DNA polymerase III epsilon subunit-like protein
MELNTNNFNKNHAIWKRVVELRDFLVEMGFYTEESVYEDIMPTITTEEELVEMEGIVYEDVNTNY